MTEGATLRVHHAIGIGLLLVTSGAGAQEPAPWGERALAEVDLLYTGGTGGVGLGRYTFELQERIADVVQEQGAEVLGVQPIHAVLAQGAHLVWAADDTAASTFAFGSGGTPTCDDAVEATALRTSHELVVVTGQAVSQALLDLPGTAAEPAELRRCSAGGAVAWWLAPVAASAPSWDLDTWDVRLGYALKVQAADGPLEIPVVGRPRQEATRRFRLLSDVLKADDDALFVDAGNFLDGVSTARSGQLSIHRSTGLQMLERLHPTALVPADNELAAGARHLLAEARARGLPYVATNWSVEDEALALPWVVRREVTSGGRVVDLAFLGAVDPDVLRTTPRLREERVTLREPSEAVAEAVDRLLLSDDPPDAIVLLARLAPERLAALRQRVHGVDLVLGDPTGATFRVSRQETDLRRVARLDKAAPVTLPQDGVAMARLRFGAEGPVAVRFTPLPVLPDMPPDPEVTRRVTRVRAQVYPGRDVVLLEEEDPIGRMSAEAFGHLACEALRDIAGADVGFLAALPDGPGVPGPLTPFLAAQRLGVLDAVEVHRVDGNKLKELLDRSEGEVATRCGGRSGTAAGRGVDADRTYRVVTTDRTRLTTRMGELVEAARGDRLLERPGWVPLTDGDAVLSLREAVLRVLRQRVQKEGTGAVAALLARTESTRSPRWSLDINKMALDLSRFDGTGRDELSAVPDAQANAPNNLTVGTDVDVALRYDSLGANWEARAKLAYRAITVQGSDPTESVDDIQLSTSSSLPLARFPRKGVFHLQPFGEVLWDSEFTPSVAEGETLPRQSDLYVTLGLTAGWSWIKRIRLGGFLNQDLARVDNKQPEFGGRFDLETTLTLPPASSLRFDTTWDLRVWGNTPQDDPSDLRVRLLGDMRLLAQPIRWFQTGVFVQGYVAKGRVPDNAVLGFSWTIGYTLSLATDVDLSRPARRRVPKRWRRAGVGDASP